MFLTITSQKKWTPMHHHISGTMDVRGVFLLMVILASSLLFGLVISLLPTFYPTEAEQKGVRPSQYGFVFGIVSLAGFISTPILATHGSKIGSKTLCITGGIVQGISNTLFGTLVFFRDTSWFICTSYALRLIEGISQVACNTAILAIVASLYTGNATRITALTRTTLGLGYMVGPIIGSFLFSLGGFGLPFYATGLSTILLSLILIFLLPKESAIHSNNIKDAIEDSQGSLTVLAVAKSPHFVMPLANTFLTFCGCGMIESMLEPHLKKSAAKATQMQVALIFTIVGFTYILGSTAAGQISDKLELLAIISILGNILHFCSFLLFGPAPYLPLEPSVILAMFASAFNGLATGLVNMSSYARLHKSVEMLGYDKSVHTNMVFSSLWIGSFHLGNFIGPTASGFLIEAIGFRSLSKYFQICFAIVLATDVILLVTMKRCRSLRKDHHEINHTEN